MHNWVICFKRSSRMFSVSIVGEKTKFAADGRYQYSHTMDLFFTMEGFGKGVSLQLKADKCASWHRRLFGTAPLVGDLMIEGQSTGTCVVQNSHEIGKAVIRLESNNPQWLLEAHRKEPLKVVSPLCVYGIESGEMVLENYYMLSSEQRASLPEYINKRDYVGYCNNLARSTIEYLIEGIGVITAVNELTVRDSYMSIGP